MVTTTKSRRSFWPLRRKEQTEETPVQALPDAPPVQDILLGWDIAPNDPLLAYFLHSSGAVELSRLNLDSPALRRLKDEGVVMVVPLVSQGELVGIINIGQRRSDQEYSSDDRRLLNDLAVQAAPAVRVAQLVRQQELAAVERERIETELRVARTIQQTLLPKEVPAIEGWDIAALWQPAREVSGDFYDFIHLDNGCLGVIIADVTDKGVPAALVMATTRTLLRAAAERLVAPGDVLARANDVLCPDIPPKMFVTCLYAVVNPASGHVRYANAGHDMPYVRRTAGGIEELRARGMPLGLLPGMPYEEKEIVLQPGDTLLLYSDGLVEAHNAKREMLGFPQLRSLVEEHGGGADLIPFLMQQLETFTGPGWEQEDDVTLLTVQRLAAPEHKDGEPAWRVLGEFDLPSEPGNERLAIEQVMQLAAGVPLTAKQIDRLKTAVGETTMNAIEHGNGFQAEVPAHIAVLATDAMLRVRIVDHGGNQTIPTAETPDLDAKLAGVQSPRGWGLFLIKNMVDEMTVDTDGEHHIVELTLKLEGAGA
ncbi:MAG: SpoIIE family protein phosphatase [Caldilineaceae bacterium]|nr:SpoIIE family protein phosphatase [Caldilineaceae bacterium]